MHNRRMLVVAIMGWLAIIVSTKGQEAMSSIYGGHILRN